MFWLGAVSRREGSEGALVKMMKAKDAKVATSLLIQGFLRSNADNGKEKKNLKDVISAIRQECDDWADNLQEDAPADKLAALYEMPNFVTKSEAQELGQSCGLKMKTFTHGDGCKLVTFIAETDDDKTAGEKIETLTANLDYKPTDISVAI